VPQSTSSNNAPSATPETQATTQTQATPPPSATGTLPTPTPGSGAVGVYVVTDGDYPYLIALKHCVADPDAWVEELLDINAADATSLSVGQELDLPPGTPPFCGDEGASDDDT
jgi:hypothetical protein